MPYPWAALDTLNAAELNAAIAAAALGVGPGAPIPGVGGYLFGLVLTNDPVTPNTLLDISVGACSDSTGTVMIALGAFTKSTGGAWAAGSGANGMGGGLTIAANTWYHVFACLNAGVSDVFFDTSAVGAHAPGGTTSFRRIGSFRTDVSSHILAFVQRGDRFDWSTPIQEYNGVAGHTTADILTLVGVPLGVSVQAMLTGYVMDTATPNSSAYLSEINLADLAPGSTGLTCVNGGINTYSSYAISIPTTINATIRKRVGSVTFLMLVITNGWIDTRGRLF